MDRRPGAQPVKTGAVLAGSAATARAPAGRSTTSSSWRSPSSPPRLGHHGLVGTSTHGSAWSAPPGAAGGGPRRRGDRCRRRACTARTPRWRTAPDGSGRSRSGWRCCPSGRTHHVGHLEVDRRARTPCPRCRCCRASSCPGSCRLAEVSQVAVRGVAEPAVAGERVVRDLVAPSAVVAPARGTAVDATLAVRDRRRGAGIDERHDEHGPTAVVLEAVVHTVSLRPPEITRPVPGRAERRPSPSSGTFGVVVVVHEVVRNTQHECVPGRPDDGRSDRCRPEATVRRRCSGCWC